MVKGINNELDALVRAETSRDTDVICQFAKELIVHPIKFHRQLPPPRSLKTTHTLTALGSENQTQKVGPASRVGCCWVQRKKATQANKTQKREERKFSSHETGPTGPFWAADALSLLWSPHPLVTGSRARLLSPIPENFF